MGNRNRKRGLALCALLAAAAALVTMTTAAPAAERTVPGPDAPTLAAALRAASPGDVLRIVPGLYHERLQVHRAVTLRPAGPGTVVVDGGGTGRVLDIFAPGVTVQGLTFRNSGDRISETDACIYVRGTAANVRLLDNHLRDCAFGIWVNGATGSLIARNTIQGRPHRILSDRGNGINLWQIHSGVIADNVIQQVRDGIYISVSSGSLVQGNRMRDLRFGIHYMYADGNRVRSNRTCDSRVGYALMFSKRLDVRGNVAYHNATYGILFRSVLDSVIVGNVVAANDQGLFLNEAAYNEISGNLVARNATGVHITGGVTDNRVFGNDFIANRMQVHFNQRVPLTWDNPGAGNYWGDYLGWDLDGDGRGDPAYYASDRMDQLVVKYPTIKLLAHSPVVRLLQALESRFPVLRPASVVETHPAMAPRAAGLAALADGQDHPCGAFPPLNAPDGSDGTQVTQR
ncbi:MAG TPA: nitrous oxide reductase family maturation protein NosD [bacterium]|nr:nitrous oxide reductase family maturation protein NosD [bacterium]